MTDTYCFLHLRGAGNNTQQLEQDLIAVQSRWREQGVEIWGIWRGLFGVASNELIVVASAAGDSPQEVYSTELGALKLIRCSLFKPTLRPSSRASLEKPGIYVFRFFSVLPENQAEFVELSGDAWTSFEGAHDYAAEPQGLFNEVREPGNDPALDMLLVTWYDSLQSWQTSRSPADSARARFVRRHQLTQRTVALATTLLPGVSAATD
jgi:hypothetical protein